MQIKLTKEDYKKLLDMIYIASWVIHAHEAGGESPKSEPYSKLEQKILSYAEKYDFDDLVIWDEHFKKYFFTNEMEESSTARDFIDEYDNNTFWDEIEERLARRDFINEYGLEKVREMDGGERIEKMHPFEEKYYDEFVENGLENIQIVKD